MKICHLFIYHLWTHRLCFLMHATPKEENGTLFNKHLCHVILLQRDGPNILDAQALPEVTTKGIIFSHDERKWCFYLRLWSERDISGSVLTEISETDWCFRLSNSTHSQRGRHYKYNNWCHESLYLDKCWKKIRVYLNQRIFIAK